ncbi:LuxR C-terminal-related transcriptional regulator [Streptomyces sp. NPDC002516]
MNVQAGQWPLVGREGELAAFERAWASRDCREIVICGPAGVGKSRLAEEYLTRAVNAGFHGQHMTATTAARAVPLGAIAHLIPAGVDLSDPVKGFNAVATALAGPRRDRRWAVLVDDLHLLDAASAVLLRQLLDAGVARLLATVRTGEPSSDAVDALVSGSAIHRVDLDVLDFARVEELLRAALGGPVGRRTVRTLHEASGGNVLYLRELVHGALQASALRSDGQIWELAEGALPGTPKLTELIGARLDAAPSAARPVLDLLALCEPVGLAHAEETVPLDVLADLEAAGLIRADTDRRRTNLSLTHPLYGETLRAGMSASRRRELLLQQAERVQGHGARRHDDALHLATWHLAATGTADPRLLTQAAFLARHAHDYSQALTLLQALSEQDQTTTTRLLHGEALYELGEHDRAEEVLADAAGRTATEDETFAIAIERTENLFWGAARVQEALTVNDAARAAVTDAGMRQALTVNEGAMRISVGETRRGLDLLGEVEEFPEERVRLYGMEVKVHALANMGRATEAMLLGQRAYAEHQQADGRSVNLHSTVQLCPLGHAYQELGELRRCQESVEAGYARAAEVRAWQPITALANMLGRSFWLTGRAAAARRAYAECLVLTRDRHFLPILLRLAASGLAASNAVLGDIEAAEAALADFRTYPDMSFLPGEDHLGEAWLLAARGDLVGARGVLAGAAEVAREAGSLSSEALLLTDIARMGGAKEVADRLAELAGACDGALAPARANLAAALAADDPDRLVAVAGELEVLGMDLLAAEAASAAATAWQRVGQARRAAAARTRAAACMARCEGARTPLLAVPEPAFPLTHREREVALLAANGTPSKDIAGALHLSVRTVDNHLQRAYAKLGITNRRELAESLGQSAPVPSSAAARR